MKKEDLQELKYNISNILFDIRTKSDSGDYENKEEWITLREVCFSLEKAKWTVDCLIRKK